MSEFESIFERAAERKGGKAALQSLLPDGENVLDAINRMKKNSGCLKVGWPERSSPWPALWPKDA